MNKQEGDILSALLAEPYINQRWLAEATGHSLGIVNRSLKNLRRDGYLDEEMGLTQKAEQEFKKDAPRNAVILADGFGFRTGAGSGEIPGGLLTVGGEPLIERTLEQLHQVGIWEIYVVVGFLKEQYEYLIDAYGVELIVNPDYSSRGTLCSLSLALSFLSNTYIIPCDVWCGSNPYHRHELYSWYMVSDSVDSESMIRVNRKMEIVSNPGQGGGSAVVGIAYLLEEQAAAVRGRITEICKGGIVGENSALEVSEQCKETEELEEFRKYKVPVVSRGRKSSGRGRGNEDAAKKAWETALYGEDRMLIPARVVSGTDAMRIHTPEQLRRMESVSGRRKADAFALSSLFLGTPPEEMVNLGALKKGAASHTFLFSGKGRKYILRMPGEGTEPLMDFGQQAQVYASISGKGFCPDPVYINPENGCRITEFPEGARSCNPMDVGDLKKCMALLRRFHEMKLKTGRETDLFSLIAYYEKLWEGRSSLYKDYKKTKEEVASLRSYIDSQKAQKVLTHMDAIPENFLFVCRRDREELLLSDSDQRDGEELQLIGWEHAAMLDPHVDIAMFCIASLYDKNQVDRLISIYFEGACPAETRLKIYCYIAVCGLLKSNWCEYKMNQGTEFGEYSLRQYRYAKEYCRIVKEELSDS